MQKNNLTTLPERLPQWISAWLKPKAVSAPQAKERMKVVPKSHGFRPRPSLEVSKQLVRSNRRIGDEAAVRKLVYASSLAALTVKLTQAGAGFNELEKRLLSEHLNDWVGKASVEDFIRLAVEDKTSVAHYAERMTAFFSEERGLLRQTCEVLLEVSKANGELNALQLHMLQLIAGVMSLESIWFFTAARALILPYGVDAHGMLRVSRLASDAEIKAAYREMVSKYHPDRLMQANEFIRGLASERAKLLSDAYQALMRKSKRAA
ncbi:MAG: J domain-containing protein [Proteobacteria bacterium]|nr:J domain-containing protein [Pseudomonadota bacterium]